MIKCWAYHRLKDRCRARTLLEIGTTGTDMLENVHTQHEHMAVQAAAPSGPYHIAILKQEVKLNSWHCAKQPKAQLQLMHTKLALKSSVIYNQRIGRIS